MSEAERAGASRQDESDRLLAGRYRLGGVLGRGGMGTVWRAKDETLGRTVAVKELRLPARIDEDEKRRLITRTFREAKAIARIRNNGAVTVYDVVDEDNRPWIVMELVEGKSLAEVIREDGLLTPKRAAEVGLAILDVLRSAHREGILHRDVKPSNVLIAEDGRVVLTDFGIAQVEGDPSITSTGMLVGAPSYISPERARGHKPGPAADLWSLGGLLYASVEGVPPYDKGSAIATLTAVMTEPMEQPKNAGPLEKVIYGLLVKDPEQRLDDAGARTMLTEVIHAPEPKDEPEPADATKVVPLPELPVDAPAKKKSSGGKAAGGSKKGEEPVERFRGALRSVRKGKGAAAAAAAGAAAVVGAGKAGAGKAADTEAPATPEGADDKAAKASTSASAPASAAPEASPSASAPASPSAAPAAADAAAASGSASEAAPRSASADSARSAEGRASAASEVNFSSVGGSSGGAGDTHPRTVAPKASLTDVVPRRTLVIVAVVVVLAVLGTILAVTLSGGDDSGTNENKGGDDKSASSGASAGSDTKQDENSGTEKDSGEKTDSAGGGANTGSSPSASASSGTGGSNDDSGSGSGDGAAETYKSGQGFSIGLPKGWKYESTSAAGSRFAGPDGQKLLVGWTTTPKSDPVADWKNQEQFMQRPQYKRIRIEKVDYRGWNTADWEFTYVDGGTQYRSIDRGFVVNGSLGYGLMYTAKGSKWDTELRKNTWQTLTKSFEPKS
ncbi:tRNA A-37 threonylcarbamoyl transferase component Bud32 [Streptomyces umbrinus]|uniref:non-specific serine/threonine protein kinase n=1 Tax=Streptomyces umbrinus TaxID=67370 RepID=A0ABU0ST62_9ACTN|nr:serine/threonine-protein kinase [Streptomyces umbrinus]MDQ1026747.1 tRNA A-37 threonylcarbamoyl transferase component Bud32 [Streptomyces umbrinus]